MNDYGEPWYMDEYKRLNKIGREVPIYRILLRNKESLTYSFIESGALPEDRFAQALKRLVNCVNACSGMQDPVKEIEELRIDAERYRKLRKHDTGYAGDEAFPKSAESYDKWVDGELL